MALETRELYPNNGAKTLIFAEKLQKLPMFGPDMLRGCLALVDPFGLVSALA